MMMLMTQSVSNASFGIYMPRYSGTIYEVLSAPISGMEIVIGYVGAAATKSIMLGLVILATARVFVPFSNGRPAGPPASLKPGFMRVLLQLFACGRVPIRCQRLRCGVAW